MILSAGDTLSVKKNLRIEVIDFANRTVLITDLDCKKTELYTWELLQSLDSFLHFNVEKVGIKED